MCYTWNLPPRDPRTGAGSSLMDAHIFPRHDSPPGDPVADEPTFPIGDVRRITQRGDDFRRALRHTANLMVRNRRYYEVEMPVRPKAAAAKTADEAR